MVNSAIIAGLVAGYTVSAVLTALLVAEAGIDDDARVRANALPAGPLPASCLGAVRRTRCLAHALARRDRTRLVTTRRQ